jgi:hypothetical protein
MVPPLFLLAGCGTPSCEPLPWSDVEVVAEDDGLRAYTEQVLAQFASWSGTDDVCLDTLTLGVVEEPKRVEGFEARGSYSVWKQDIVVEPDSEDLYGDLFHELCHALDATSGYTLGEGGGFDLDGLPDYYTGWHAVTEAFSMACEAGPDDVGRYARWRDECEVDVPDFSTAEYVTEAAFPGAPRADWEAPTFAVEPGVAWEAQAPDGWELDAWESAGDTIVLLYTKDRASWAVRFADPITGAELAWWEEDVCGERPSCRADLVPSPEGAWLRIDAEETSWRRPEGLAFVPVDTPCAGDADFVADGAIWWDEIFGNSVDLRRCDLVTGLVEAVERPAAPGPHALGLDWASVVLTERGAAFHDDDVGLTWPTESGWESLALPGHLAVREVIFRGEEAFLSVQGHATTETDYRTGLVRLDLGDGTLHAPTTACVPGVEGSHDLLVVGATIVVVNHEDATTFQPMVLGP